MSTNAFVSNAERLAKEAENYPAIFGSLNLTSIRDNVGEILKLIGRDGIFREYTLHDMNHIDAMLALVDKLVPEETAKRMTTADWLMIVLSCYFHDLGMVVTKKEFENRRNGTDFPNFCEELYSGDRGKDYAGALENLNEDDLEEFLYQEFVRKNHANRIFHWIQGQDARQYGDARQAVEVVNELLSGLEGVVRDDLARICRSHHEDDLYDFDKYKLRRVYGDIPQAVANLHYAAMILRTADVLQIQKKRVPTVLYKLIDPSNPKSQEEWAKQAGVRAVVIQAVSEDEVPDTVEVHASFEDETAYFGLLAYLQQYADKELEKCWEWGRQAEKAGSTYHYPWRRIDSRQVEPRGFESKPYSFALDQERILKLLTGHTLYNDSRVAVRELMQNALDAIRFQKFMNPAEPLGQITVTWDSKERELVIRDTGTGMTQEIIEKYLLNVGASFYQSEIVRQKYSDFSPISRFGIGVLSTFMIADMVQFLTVHPDEEYARLLTLPSVVKVYLGKKIPKGDPMVQAIGAHGTEVTLKIRKSVDLLDVEALLRYWIVIPACQVTCIIDDSDPITIGFPDVRVALEHYFQKEQQQQKWFQPKIDLKTEKETDVELAYVILHPFYFDVWLFAPRSLYQERGLDDLETCPGLCIEGIRVRSIPAGFEDSNEAPWVLANLTGRNIPKTNVARSDLEHTEELEQGMERIYRLLSNHIRGEFDRLLEEGAGLVNAAREADYLLRTGFDN